MEERRVSDETLATTLLEKVEIQYLVQDGKVSIDGCKETLCGERICLFLLLLF